MQDHHVVKARPKAIHFEGYRPGKLHQQTLVSEKKPPVILFCLLLNKFNSLIVIDSSERLYRWFKPAYYSSYYRILQDIVLQGTEQANVWS